MPLQTSLADAKQQLAQHQQQSIAQQTQMDMQAAEISALQELTNQQTSSLEKTAEEASHSQQELTATIDMLKVLFSPLCAIFVHCARLH